MSNNSKLLLVFLFIFGAAFFITSTIEFPMADRGANDESKEKKQWELEMLRDPATGKIPEGIRFQELAFYNNFPRTNNKRGTDWRLRGPWNVGGRTRTMAIDILDESHMIAGSVSGGIWQSFNAGSSWQKVSEPNAHPGVVSIAQDTRAGYENIWYALSGEIHGTSASATGAFYLGDGAFRSLDNGNTWQPLASTAVGVPGNSLSSVYQGGWRIKTSPSDGAVYMAVYGAIYRSIDTGNTWTAILGSGNNSYYTDVAVSKTGIVYATLSSGGGTKGFFRAANGINFTNITPAFLSEYNRTVIEIDPNDETTVYFLSELECKTCGGVTSANYLGEEEYISLLRYKYISGPGSPSNGGGLWSNLSNNLPLASTHPFDNFNCQGGYDLCVRVQPGNSNNMVIGGTNLYRNTDGFNSIASNKQIGGYGVGTTLPFFEVYPNHHPDQHDVYFSRNNPNVMYSVSDGGMRRTEDFLSSQVNWQDISWGYVTAQCYTVNIDQKNAGDQRMMVGLQDNGNYVSLTDNQQQEWRMPVNGDGAFGYISPNNDFFVTSLQLGRIVKIKLDDRGNLVRRRRIDPAGKSKNDYSFINPFAIDPSNENIMYLPIGKKLYRLDNLKGIAINNNYDQLADSWVALSDSIKTPYYITGSDTTISKISCLAIAPNGSGTVYVGTNNAEIYRIENAHTANPVWVLTSKVKLPPRANVNNIAIDPDDENKVLVCYSNYAVQSLVYTSNGGQTWDLAGGTIESSANPSGSASSVRSVAILRTATGGRKYFAGTSIGLFSTDSINTTINFTNWQQESPDLIGANIVTDIKVRQSDGYIAVATHGNGVFETYYRNTKNPATSSVQLIAYPIFPNPANSTINFAIGTGENSDVKVQLMNMNGQYFMTKSLGLHIKGVFNYSLDVSHIPTGMYLMGVFSEGSDHKSYQKIIIQH